MQNGNDTNGELMNDPDDKTIAELAAKLNQTVYVKSAELAREVLKRPRKGTEEWRSEHEARDTPEGRLRTTQEYLTRLRILKAAKVDLERTVLEARDKQITWEQIGEACGVSRQGAYDRWGKAAKQTEQLRAFREVAADWEREQRLDAVEKFDPGGERTGTPRRRGRSSAPRSRR
jgi:hypothetical protein